MFETIEQILSVALGGFALLSAVTGLIVSLLKNCKNKKIAGTAEKINGITELAVQKVIEVEKLFSQASSVLKAVGIKTGEIKKESVMTYLEGCCMEQKIAFDSDYWAEKSEKLVEVLNACGSR